MATSISETLNYPSEWLKWEEGGWYSRENVTILAGSGAVRALTSGMVLGKIAVGAATPAAYAGNAASTGTIGTVTVGAGAKPGVYNVVIVEPATNAGKFTVEDPDGVTVGTGTVAVAFSGGGLGFTMADGATDFISGEGFTITVAAGSAKYVQMDDAGTDGRQNAAGILIFDTTAPDGADIKAAIIARNAIVSDNGIKWKSTVDSTEKAAAVVQLKALGIQVREGA